MEVLKINDDDDDWTEQQTMFIGLNITASYDYCMILWQTYFYFFLNIFETYLMVYLPPTEQEHPAQPTQLPTTWVRPENQI